MTACRRRLLRAAVCLAATSLTACTTTPRHSAPLLSGRLALKVDAGEQRPAQSLSASFELQGQADAGRLRLLSPLGQVLADARWDPHGALLVTRDGLHRHASLADLSLAALGEDVPLQALPDWLSGRPWPGSPHETAPEGSDEGFEQLGWRIFLQGWREQGIWRAERAQSPHIVLRVRLDR
ncbi:outer membrane lipoprotein LolB [Ideonella livida]|uniref:Outer-membrane lipoprotein LolB n=1 Tax=Ideonella livida TaxID=2707176 RepID=A0A7C9TJV0_9BURK|nr:outer membrane lipoprotein LolB [Ideonella livida]NDY92261.1 outer membrane lipoprotein LolB [Ideonella livida]